MEISYKYTKPEVEENRISKCCNCQRSDCFTILSGYRLCENCGFLNGHVLGYFDNKDYDRLHFRKKSIYQRKYHYKKKIDEVCKIIFLNDEQKYELYMKLNAIDDKIMEVLKKKFCRKRIISIFYIIKEILQEMGNEQYNLICLKISDQTLEIYNKWWDSYKILQLSEFYYTTPV